MEKIAVNFADSLGADPQLMTATAASRQRMRMRRARPKEDPEINLISLIDIALLLVIFFMLSSTFMQEGAAQDRAAAGEPRAHRQAENRSHRGDGHAERQLSRQRARAHQLLPDTLRAAILEVAGADRDKPVTVRADGRATHQSVVTAMDVLGKLGFVRINIATVEESTPAK